jgi:hypothetical protein
VETNVSNTKLSSHPYVQIWLSVCVHQSSKVSIRHNCLIAMRQASMAFVALIVLILKPNIFCFEGSNRQQRDVNGGESKFHLKWSKAPKLTQVISSSQQVAGCSWWWPENTGKVTLAEKQSQNGTLRNPKAVLSTSMKMKQECNSKSPKRTDDLRTSWNQRNKWIMKRTSGAPIHTKGAHCPGRVRLPEYQVRSKWFGVPYTDLKLAWPPVAELINFDG